ncbi:MAG: hypothetical protein CVV33_03795 [Methanomicrobiales archaeon HGW-Methanomicrobiales-4]|nr:MAG: hypothetical protein CVV33_03795 [Methanomicrobiales archaeon HGW-Methanomicrobiales-4]
MINISTNYSEEQLNNPCILGYEVAIYKSEICEILNQIRRPGDIRTPPKIAVISPTFFSRNMVAESVAREITVLVKRENFQRQELKPELFDDLFDENRVFICEECQYLYERHPHGFDLLRSFLSQIVTNPRQIITTWNQYSWNFLSGFLQIERWFPIVITLPFLSRIEMQQFLLSTQQEGFRYVIDKELDNTLEFVRKDLDVTISSINLSFSIPYLSIRRRYATYIPLLADKKTLPEEIIFGAIYRLSLGDPGIASAFWNQAKVETEIRFSRLSESVMIPDLFPLDIFILTSILMYEYPTYNRLIQFVKDDAILNSALYRLVSAGVVARNEEEWYVTTEGFAPAVQYLIQRRMIW